MISITRLEGGHTASEVYDIARKGGTTPNWATDLGGPNAVAPGDTSNATIVLHPGRYMMSCFVAASDGNPHLLKGMFAQFEVTATHPVSYVLPRSSVTIHLRDYRIDLSRPLTRGTYTFQVINDGPQEHDVQILKLNGGRSAEQALDWFEKPNGPVSNPPAKAMGGMVGLNKGKTGFFSATFGPGSYLIFCWVPDEKDGRAHFRHGMIRRFTVP
jgi:hypothetical protein